MPVYELILSSDTINEGRIKINNAFSATTGLWSGSTGFQSLIHNNESGNIAAGDYSIAAGYNSVVDSDYSAIIGGYQQGISNDSTRSFIGGGNLGAYTSLTYSISGSSNSVILGGNALLVYDSINSFIGGGSGSVISNNSGQSAIVGGAFNVLNNSNSSVILGGVNKMKDSPYSIMGGGSFTYENNLTGCSYVVLLGGRQNLISEGSGFGADYSVIIGGRNNQISSSVDSSSASAIICGVSNSIPDDGAGSVILGGNDNEITGSNSAIISGSFNEITAPNSVILGGSNNLLNASSSVVIGQSVQTVSAFTLTMGYALFGGPNVANNTIALNATDGGLYYNGGLNSGGADYAEFFEWSDGNLSKEDRVGYFVSLIGDKIVIDNSNIVGVVSSNPSVVGDSAELKWNEIFQKDEWGKVLTEKYDIYELIKDDGEKIKIYIDENRNTYLNPPYFDNIIGVLYTGDTSNKKYLESGISNKINPSYDSNQTYIPRKDRSEWSPIGLLGKLYVRTSEVINGTKVSADSNGMAINGTDYHVLKTIKEYDGNYGIVQILFK